jgi:hypothetical protein
MSALRSTHFLIALVVALSMIFTALTIADAAPLTSGAELLTP